MQEEKKPRESGGLRAKPVHALPAQKDGFVLFTSPFLGADQGARKRRVCDFEMAGPLRVGC